MEDLNTIIEDSITDVEIASPEPTETTETAVEAAPEAVETPVEPQVEEPNPLQAETPATRAEEAAKPADDFDKKFGLTALSSSGRENRIPYTRVKKITEKAVNDAKKDWSKSLETSHVPLPKYAELETKVKGYEGQLTQVAEFERVLDKEPIKFLQFLYKHPAYTQIFDQMAVQAGQPAKPSDVAEVVPDDFPQPDQELSDGSKVYSMDGLKALRAWDRKQVEATVLKQIEARYAPLEASFNSYQKVQAVLPAVNKQIEEARTWNLFNENEDAIVKVLQENPNFSLERAYQAVVFPKMKAEHERLTNEAKVTKDSIRAQVLKELKQAPHSTSVTSTASRPAPTTSTGPRSLEDIISQSIQGLK